MTNSKNFLGSKDIQMPTFNHQVESENQIIEAESASLRPKRGRRPGVKVTQCNEDTVRITLNIPVSIISGLDNKAVENNTTRTSLIIEKLSVYKDQTNEIKTEKDALKALLNGTDFADLPSTYRSNEAFFIKFSSILPEIAVEQIVSRPSWAQYIPKEILLQYALQNPNVIAFLPKNMRKEAFSAFEKAIKENWISLDKEAQL